LDFVGEQALAQKDPISAGAFDFLDADTAGGIGLGIEVKEQDAAAQGGNTGGEIDGSRRFADAAFLVRYRDDPGWHAADVMKSAARFKLVPALSLDFIPLRRQYTCMNFILSAHNVRPTRAIEDHIVSRIQKLEHLDHFATRARVTIEHDQARSPERAFSCSMRIFLPGPDLFAEDVESDLYAAIDLVAKKIEQQIRKRHNKFKARNVKVASRGKRTRQEDGKM